MWTTEPIKDGVYWYKDVRYKQDTEPEICELVTVKHTVDKRVIAVEWPGTDNYDEWAELRERWKAYVYGPLTPPPDTGIWRES